MASSFLGVRSLVINGGHGHSYFANTLDCSVDPCGCTAMIDFCSSFLKKEDTRIEMLRRLMFEKKIEKNESIQEDSVNSISTLMNDSFTEKAGSEKKNSYQPMEYFYSSLYLEKSVTMTV